MKSNKPDYVLAGLDTLWWGISIGGRHYTGKIKYNLGNEYKIVEIERKLSRKEAKQYSNEEERYWLKWSLETCKFEKLEDLERRATQYCKENFADNWLLVDNDWHNPNRVIAANGIYLNIVPALNELYEYYRKLSNIQIEDNWDKIYGRFNEIMSRIKKVNEK